MTDRTGRCPRCKAEVFFAQTVPNDKRILIDPAPDPKGDYVLVVGVPLVAYRIGRYVGAPAGTPLRRCHFDTCVNRSSAPATASVGSPAWQRKQRPAYDHAGA